MYTRAEIEDAYFRALRRARRLANGCVVFAGAKSPNGYGKIRIRFAQSWKTINVHKLSDLFWNGVQVEPVDVRHRCDNPPCFADNHLERGTHRQNFRDILERKRIRFDAKGNFARVNDDCPF